MKSIVYIATTVAVLCGAAAAFVALLLEDASFALALVGGAVVASSIAVALSHRSLARASRRAREVAQRDTRAITWEVRQVAAAQEAARDEGAAQSGLSSSGVNSASVVSPDPVASVVSPDQVATVSKPVVSGNNFGVTGTFFGLGPDYEYAQRARQHIGRFETFALRSKSGAARDVLARTATNMQFNYEDMLIMLRALRAGRLPGAATLLAEWHVPSLLATARVLANQRSRRSDLADSAKLFGFVVDVHGVDSLGRSDIYTYSEVLAEIGQDEQAQRLFRKTGMHRRDRVHMELMRANSLLNGGVHNAEVARKWAAQLSALLERDGRSGVELDMTQLHRPFDALRGTATPRTVEGPLVTVIVPTYNGAEYLETTISCLRAQTWKNLEIIVVDDASAADQRDLAREICGRHADDVTLLLQEENLGAYVARNRALRVARGEFVTVHDDDDWSHPEKIEVQAADLMARGPRAANMTRHVRTGGDLRMGRINNNPSFSQANFSSLMLSRTLFDEVGAWDDVNRGADAEFRDRLVRHIGAPVDILGEAPLSLTRTHDASLTAGEIGRGYLDPSRLLYQASYLRAHQAVPNDGMPTLHRSASAFARPLNMQPGLRRKNLGTFDVAFGSDFRFPGGTSALTLNEIEEAARSGKRVGVLQLDSALNAYSLPYVDRLFELAMLENVEILSLNDDAQISALIVRHPSVLQFADGLTSRLEVGAMAIIVNNPPILTGGTGGVYSFSDVVRNGESLFGLSPDIVPESGVTREQCLRMAPDGILAEYNWPGFVDTRRFGPPESRDFGRRPVLGRHSRDDVLKWPDKYSTIEQLYAGTDAVETRILGGVSKLPLRAAQMLQERARVTEFGGLGVPEFLAGLDFWAYYHSAKLTESFGMATAEAMAAGLPVFLPKYMQATFGEGAIYVEPHEVRERVLKLWGDPEAYREQSERARRVAVETFSAVNYQERLAVMIAHGNARLAESTSN